MWWSISTTLNPSAWGPNVVDDLRWHVRDLVGLAPDAEGEPAGFNDAVDQAEALLATSDRMVTVTLNGDGTATMESVDVPTDEERQAQEAEHEQARLAAIAQAEANEAASQTLARAQYDAALAAVQHPQEGA